MIYVKHNVKQKQVRALCHKNELTGAVAARFSGQHCALLEWDNSRNDKRGNNYGISWVPFSDLSDDDNNRLTRMLGG